MIDFVSIELISLCNLLDSSSSLTEFSKLNLTSSLLVNWPRMATVVLRSV